MLLCGRGADKKCSTSGCLARYTCLTSRSLSPRRYWGEEQKRGEEVGGGGGGGRGAGEKGQIPGDLGGGGGSLTLKD